LATLLAQNGHPVRLWSTEASRRDELRRTRIIPTSPGVPLHPGVEPVEEAPGALHGGLVFLAIHPGEVRALVRALSGHLRPDHRIVHLARGFEDGDHTVSRVLTDESCVLQVGALAGPIVPAELWRGDDAAAVVGSRFHRVGVEVQDVLAQGKLRVYGTHDLVGLEVGGALRVPVALAAGMLQALGLGKAMLAVLLTRAVAEGARLAVALGGEEQTLSGLGGIGDWMATVHDPLDPVVGAGRRLVDGARLEHPEAERRLRALEALARRKRVDLPIVHAVAAVVGGTPAPRALAALMARPSRGERD
jgi:glycerol-3-phosphate dehydrogenase (NAD(P)+)